MKKKIALFFVMVGLNISSTAYSYNQSPPCYLQIQQTFFRQDLLTSALSLYSVNQNIWMNVYRDLQVASQRVPSIVQSYAMAESPNPLDPVFMPQQATALLQKSLYDVFQGVMRFYASQGNTIIDQNTINGMFRYLWEQQANQLAGCLNLYPH